MKPKTESLRKPRSGYRSAFSLLFSGAICKRNSVCDCPVRIEVTMRGLFVSVLTLLAGPAAAQTTTTCTPTGVAVKCQSQPSGSIDWTLNRGPDFGAAAANAYEAGVAARNARQEQQQPYVAPQSAATASSAKETDMMVSRYKAAGRMLREGKCAEAKQFATDTGDAELLLSLTRICDQRNTGKQ